jgi:hypothetical protein
MIEGSLVYGSFVTLCFRDCQPKSGYGPNRRGRTYGPNRRSCFRHAKSVRDQGLDEPMTLNFRLMFSAYFAESPERIRQLKEGT